MTFYYYPQLNPEDMTEEDFAFWSENAQWMHSQMLMIQQTNALGMLGSGGGK